MFLNSVGSIYVACALMAATGAHQAFVRRLISLLERRFKVNKFYSLAAEEDPAVKDLNLFRFNQEQIEKSDAIVAFCDFPSDGRGMELVLAKAARKKIILVCKRGVSVSKMITSFAELYNIPFVLYSSADPMSDIVERISRELNK